MIAPPFIHVIDFLASNFSIQLKSKSLYNIGNLNRTVIQESKWGHASLNIDRKWTGIADLPSDNYSVEYVIKALWNVCIFSLWMSHFQLFSLTG